MKRITGFFLSSFMLLALLVGVPVASYSEEAESFSCDDLVGRTYLVHMSSYWNVCVTFISADLTYNTYGNSLCSPDEKLYYVETTPGTYLLQIGFGCPDAAGSVHFSRDEKHLLGFAITDDHTLHLVTGRKISPGEDCVP